MTLPNFYDKKLKKKYIKKLLKCLVDNFFIIIFGIRNLKTIYYENEIRC